MLTHSHEVAMVPHTKVLQHDNLKKKYSNINQSKTYSNIYKKEWIQPWPMGSEIYPEIHEREMLGAPSNYYE